MFSIGGGWITYFPTSNSQEIKIEEKENNGCTCKKCDNFYEFAEPNQEDKTFICWACRHGY